MDRLHQAFIDAVWTILIKRRDHRIAKQALWDAMISLSPDEKQTLAQNETFAREVFGPLHDESIVQLRLKSWRYKAKHGDLVD